MKLHILLASARNNHATFVVGSQLDAIYTKNSDIDYTILNDQLNTHCCPWGAIQVPGAPLGHWGHPARNWWMSQQQPDPDRLIWHIDDDDTLANDAAAIIMQTAKPGTLNIYRYYHRLHKKLYWHTQGAAMLNNVGTPCGVHPIIPDMPRFELYRGGDGAFFQALAERIPVRWVDEVIYFV